MHFENVVFLSSSVGDQVACSTEPTPRLFSLDVGSGPARVPGWVVVERRILHVYLVKHSSLFQGESGEPGWPAFNCCVEHFKYDNRAVGEHVWKCEDLQYWLTLRALSRQAQYAADRLLVKAEWGKFPSSLYFQCSLHIAIARDRERREDILRNGPFSTTSESDDGSSLTV